MIYKEHTIELFINGQKADLESQKSLNLRFQNVLFNPEKITSSQAEYSFEFELPSTPVNDKIFDFANNLSKVGKFRSRLNAEVYADGAAIFAGTLTLNSYKDKQYSCNLVSVKVYSLEDIFGDATLTDINNWKIDFSGVTTINEINADNNSKVVFPLISYGAFQKSPIYADDAGSDYTSKYDLDEYNRWYVESFYPSLNMLETIKKAFEWKDYKVGGDAFTDPVLKNIFMSTNLADGQSPVYNLGNPDFGKVSLDVDWSTPGRPGYIQELKYPYFVINGYMDYSQGQESKVEDVYNFREVELYDILEEGTVTVNAKSYMYQPDEHIIVIPADGFYNIELSISASAPTVTALTATQWIREVEDGHLKLEHIESDIDVIIKNGGTVDGRNFFVTTPLEIQLVKNYDDNIELIKGKYNLQILDGNPNHSHIGGDEGLRSNYVNFYTCFPHEKLGRQYGLLPRVTKMDDLANGNNNNFYTTDSDFGYMPDNSSTLMAYDPVVSPAFICGFSSMGMMESVSSGGQFGTIGATKNGFSWSKTYSEKQEGFYNCLGYAKCDWSTPGVPSTGYVFTSTDYQKNEYLNAPAQGGSISSTRMILKLTCCVKLNKNDRLQLYAVHRAYENISGYVHYDSSVQAHLEITAKSSKSYEILKASDFNYNTPIDFETQLNLAQFLNKDKKISEFVQNATDAFNLEILQNEKNIELNVKKKFNRNLFAAVDLDNRVNSENAEASKIDYPSSMAVKYKIDADEHGFYDSVPPEHINDEDWKDYGESGYSIVTLNDDTYVTSRSDKNLQFSYTWYDDFNWFPVDSAFTKTSSASTTLTIPVISKEEYMIDGYDYTESMKHDGYGLAQRFWYRPTGTQQYVWTRTYPAEQVNIYKTSNVYNNVNLSYKVNENSLLQRYFNITPYLASNYVIVEAYITPDEYNMIKNGALIRFDSDIYYPVEVNGYDPSGYNPTEIKMMKKL